MIDRRYGNSAWVNGESSVTKSVISQRVQPDIASAHGGRKAERFSAVQSAAMKRDFAQSAARGIVPAAFPRG
jgi:hypothetical protein